MKKIKLSLVGCSLLFLSSCYTSKVAVGDIKVEDPTVKVNSVKNHNLIYGLIPLSKGYDAKAYVGNKSNYIIKTQHSFVDGLLNAVTFGVYNPTTTTFYLPLNELK